MTLLGVDVGGTFTDLVFASAGRTQVTKVPSTPADQTIGILDGLARLGVEPGALRRFVHGTTVATNTVLERDGARTVLVTTAGFRDLLTIARQDRPHLYRLDARRPPPLVEPPLVVEATERIGADGAVVLPLDDAEVTRVVAEVAALNPEAVAVSLLFGFLVDDHERRLGAALAELGVPVTLASELLPVMREVERTSTAVANAYLAPRMTRYLTSLETQLESAGLTVPVEVMRSGGGTSVARVAAREPIHTVLSGPAAGAWGAAELGRSLGATEVIAFDVGGTSTDVTLISEGRPTTVAGGLVGGLPLAVTTTDIHTIGAGGGSLAWRDAGGALRVGPRSAGADPGPACYGRGGTGATVTDANLVLGRLDRRAQLGGTLRLDRDAAIRTVAGLGADLGLDGPTCAEGIVRVADAQMVQALRVVSVERGRDPRDFDLLPFGGAGGLHQAALAAALGCPRVLVPPHPGVLSAQGLLAAPVTADRARSRLMRAQDLTAAWLRNAVKDLDDDACAHLTEQRVAVAARRHSADLRYRGQAFELEVTLPPDGAPAELVAAFHRAHRDQYGYDQPGEDVELVTLRVRVEGAAPALPLPPLVGGGSTRDAVVDHREVVVDGRACRTPVIRREALGAGARLRGPAVVGGDDATVWVAPWQQGEVDDHGVLVLTAVAP